jgi:hypothetical protein
VRKEEHEKVRKVLGERWRRTRRSFPKTISESSCSAHYGPLAFLILLKSVILILRIA